MNNQLQEDISEAEPYLEKSSGRRSRREKSAKARSRRDKRNSKLEQEYEDGFRGNHSN